ncbi:MAG: protein kinase [Deltaproteobacteria bacterium]|nr:protein kinase [Deltaproteobacteria bacterium]
MGEIVFDKYQVIRRLAVGGMGEIYLAQQTGVSGFERHVILKRLLPQFNANQRFIEQFLDEARLAANLNHPNIMSIYEVGRWHNTYYIAMEYVHGVDLARLSERMDEQGSQMPFPVAARIVHDVAMGLNHAHAATDSAGRPLRLVHRDVSPSNIMVRMDGVTKLVDFGIAKAELRTARTETGMVKGKLGYLSPEQALGEKEVDARSDQFSLGVVLWELCTQCRLYNGVIPSRFAQPATFAIPLPSSVAPEVPSALDAIASRMLTPERNERFQDCSEVAAALGQYLQTQSSPTDTRDVAAFVGRVAGDEIRRRLTPSPEVEAPNYVVDFGVLPAAARPPPGRDEVGGASEERATVERGVAPKRPRAHRRPLALTASAAAAAALAIWLLQSPITGRTSPVALPPPSARPGEAAPGVGPVTDGGATENRVARALAAESPPEVPVDENRGTRAPQPPLVHENNRRTERDGRGKATVAASKTGAEPVRAGYLSLVTAPWSKVTIAGRSHGSTPIYRLELAAGVHELTLSPENGEKAIVRHVRIRPGETLKLKCPMVEDHLEGDCSRSPDVW